MNSKDSGGAPRNFFRNTPITKTSNSLFSQVNSSKQQANLNGIYSSSWTQAAQRSDYMYSIPNSTRHQIQVNSFSNGPEEMVVSPDIYSNGHIGFKSVVQKNVSAINWEFNMAVGDNIRNGPFGAIGYTFGGNRGSFLAGLLMP